MNEAKPPRPRSAVSHGVGIAGLCGLFSWVSIAIYFGLDGPYSALTNVLACGIPMVLWSIFVDRVHRNPTTGIDWDSTPRRWSEISEVKGGGHFTLQDRKQLIERASGDLLKGWGEADQPLPGY